MSIRTVSRQVRTALQDQKITGAEARAIVSEAEKGRITTGEAKKVADVYNQGNQWTTAGPMGHLNPPRVQMEGDANNVLSAFFLRNSVPAGGNFVGVKAQIEDVLSRVRLGTPLDSAPNTKHLHEVHIDDMRMLDGPRTDAFLDTEKKEFYVKYTGAGMAGPDTIGPYWHGPIGLPEGAINADQLKAQLEGDYTKTRRLGEATMGRLSRSDSVTVEDVTKRDDGNYDVTSVAVTSCPAN